MVNYPTNGLLAGPYAGQSGASWVNPWSQMTAQQSYPYQRFGQFMNLYRYPQFPRANFQNQYAETAATAAANNQAPPGVNPDGWQAQQAAQQPPAGTYALPGDTWGGQPGPGVTPQTSVGPATYSGESIGSAPPSATPPPASTPPPVSYSPSYGKPQQKSYGAPVDHFANFKGLLGQNPQMANEYRLRSGDTLNWWNNQGGRTQALSGLFGGDQSKMNDWINSTSMGPGGAQAPLDQSQLGQLNSLAGVRPPEWAMNAYRQGRAAGQPVNPMYEKFL